MDGYIHVLKARFPDDGDYSWYSQSAWENIFTNNAKWLYVNNNYCYFNEDVYCMAVISKSIVLRAGLHYTSNL